MLGKELAQLEGRVVAHITHIKLGDEQAVMGQIAALKLAHDASLLTAETLMTL